VAKAPCRRSTRPVAQGAQGFAVQSQPTCTHVRSGDLALYIEGTGATGMAVIGAQPWPGAEAGRGEGLW
jgi:hypothetical protein